VLLLLLELLLLLLLVLVLELLLLLLLLVLLLKVVCFELLLVVQQLLLLFRLMMLLLQVQLLQLQLLLLLLAHALQLLLILKRHVHVPRRMKLAGGSKGHLHSALYTVHNADPVRTGPGAAWFLRAVSSLQNFPWRGAIFRSSTGFVSLWAWVHLMLSPLRALFSPEPQFAVGLAANLHSHNPRGRFAPAGRWPVTAREQHAALHARASACCVLSNSTDLPFSCPPHS
jgi:hypothetical protein